MKISKYLGVIVIFITIVICACNKNENRQKVQNPISGKLKILEQAFQTGTDTFYFTYDSISGDLKSIVEHSYNQGILIITNVSKPNSSKLIFDTRDNSRRKILYVHLDGNGNIQYINNVDTLFGTEEPLYTFLKNGIEIDSVFEPPVGFPFDITGDIKDYNLMYDGNNYSSATKSSVYSPIFGVKTYDTCISEFRYTSLINNNNQIPMQNIIDNIGCLPYGGPFISSLYFVELAGYFPSKPNKNLIATVNGRAYTYQQNLSGQVVEMKIDSLITFRMTYY